MADQPNIGWIGLGKMGTPMSLNLRKAGLPLSVYNRTPSKAKLLTDAGAAVARDIASLAAGSNIVISMINDDESLREVSMSAGGVLANARQGSIYVDMSTVSPAASEQVAVMAEEKGIAYVRAPVSGSITWAEAGELVILTSGPKAACDACACAFEAMGRKTVYLGAGEEARFLKLTVNMMVGISAAMFGEALAFGEAGGLDWDQMLDTFADGPVSSPLYKYKYPALKDRNFAPAFSATQIAKDFDLILDTGRAGNVPMPMTSTVRQFWSAMIATGKENDDMFAYVTLMEELAGIKGPVRKKT